MKNLKIGVKIFLSFGTVILMMFAITGTVLITNLQTIRNIKRTDADTSLQSYVVSLQRQFMRARIQAQVISLQYSEEAFNEYESYISGALGICDEVYVLIDENESLESMRQSITDLRDEISAWDKAMGEIKQGNLLCMESRDKAYKAEFALYTCVEYLMKYLRNDITLEIYMNDLERMDSIDKSVEYTFNMEKVTREISVTCMDAREIMLHFNREGADTVIESLRGSIDSINALNVVSVKTGIVVQELVNQLKIYIDSFSKYADDGEILEAALASTKQAGAKAVDGMDTLIVTVEETVNAQMADTSRLANLALIIVVAVAVAAFAVALVMAALIYSGISKPVRLLGDVLLQIGSRGELDMSPELSNRIGEIASGKDEIAVAMHHLGLMSNRLKDVGNELGRVAGGDLTTDIALLSEADTMGIALNKMVDSLNGMFHELNVSTVYVSNGARRISDSAQALAQGSTQQTLAVEQLSGSISEIADETKDNAEQAAKAAELSAAVRRSAERGAEQMREMMLAVKDINDASNSISKVIKVIDEIAFQTNILALNAAVEAARAGQHGKGFAVVAEEVRSLAAKSAAAAGNTGELISNSMEKARLGAHIAEDTSASLGEIVSGINETSEIVGRIAKSSEQQSRAIEQVNSGIDKVAKVVQINSSTARESAEISERLSEQSETLNELMSQFKLTEQTQTMMLESGE